MGHARRHRSRHAPGVRVGHGGRPTDLAGPRSMLASLGLGAIAVLVLAVLAPATTSTSLPGLPQLPTAEAVGALAPEDYVDGACVALAPTAPDRGATVLLDAGHGAPDIGSTGVTGSGEKIPEKDLTLPLVLRAAEDLRARGIRVALSRSIDAVGKKLGPGDVEAGALTESGLAAQLAARARCANLAGADALVSVHFNAFDEPDVDGFETLYDADRPFGADNARLAQSLQSAIGAGYRAAGRDTDDRGVVGSDSTDKASNAAKDLVLLGATPRGSDLPQSEMPGAVIEPLFITDPSATDFVRSDEGRRVLADSIGDGVEAFLRGPDPRR
ncbi:N-acetylmuramoyl-L-alanine amidase [Actinomycetospora endophytica]|uniref:N-acetylmuramoyl-L-alanine amidase n=1 Tax=Actinomycetospora endophytica TaxID=2291215 RepID=A0ABS8P632_9PSEU|nr:N-acetylmuramoyl-L-alanine amidase [Actinomycetospora endophytica]MCD2193713.1 N-acetylmuramoyl-L-alanine amidase [Actinomycetospora endophytica]